MEANILKKYWCLWLYFIVSIGITACSIIMDVALVIKTAERYFVYFIATRLMSVASYSFHFVVHLFIIYKSVFLVFMLDVILDYIPFNTLSSPSTFFIIFDIRIHLRLKTNEFSDWDATSFVLEFSNDFLIDIAIIW